MIGLCMLLTFWSTQSLFVETGHVGKKHETTTPWRCAKEILQQRCAGHCRPPKCHEASLQHRLSLPPRLCFSSTKYLLSWKIAVWKPYGFFLLSTTLQNGCDDVRYVHQTYLDRLLEGRDSSTFFFCGECGTLDKKVNLKIAPRIDPLTHALHQPKNPGSPRP